MQNKDFYNSVSMEGGFFEKKFKIISKLIKPGKTVLDLGCYDGRVGDFLVRELNCIVDGADISDLNISKAKNLHNKFIFDLNDKIWPIGGKYDYVVFTDVIEHVLDTDQFMINVKNLVEEDGCIIFSTPNVASFGRRIMLLFGKNPYIEVSNHREVNLFNAPAVGHIRYFTLGTMKSIAEFYEFEIEKIVPTSFMGCYSNKFLERWFPGLCWHLFVVARKKNLTNLVLNDINFGFPHGRIAWVKKMNYFNKNGLNISLVTNEKGANYYKGKIKLKNILLFSKVFSMNKKLFFIIHALINNILSLTKIKQFKEFSYIYSLATLDSILLPYFVKKYYSGKVKWVVQFDNIVPLNDPGNKFIRFLAWLFFKISLIFLKKADKIFAISEDLKKFLIKRGFRENQIIVTGNAVEGDMIKMARKDLSYNIDALFVGRINETKGIYDMLKVLDIVKKEYPNFQWAIMGNGDEKTMNQFKQAIKKTGLENNIQFLGYKDGVEKFNIIKSSKCFWFLSESESESESFGIALLEAVCSGLPSFVYDLLPYKNIYKNNEVMVFKKNDYRAVADKVIEIFNKKEFDNKNGELLIDKYSWDKIAEIEFNSFKD